MKRIGALARITFLEGIRNRSVYGIWLFSLFILGLNIAVAGFFMREVGKVTVDMNLSALSLAGLLLIFFSGLNLLSKDIDKKTIHLVLSKPLSRNEYVWGKFLGLQAFVGASLSILLLLSCATVFLLEKLYPSYFGSFSWAVFFLAVFFIYLKMLVLIAITVFFSTLTTNSFITLIFSFSAYVVGETIEEVIFFLRGALAAQEVVISDLLRTVLEAFSYIVPNLAVFDYKVEAAHGLAISGERVLYSAGYGAAYTVCLLLLAGLVFKRREFN